MNVEHGLASLGVTIYNEPVARFGNSIVLGYPRRSEDHVPQKFLVVGGCIVDRADMFVWNNQYVNWRLWVNVAECQYLVILIDNICWNILADDIAE